MTTAVRTLTWFPTAAILLFYSYVLRARLVLGYWPVPYQPDPKELGFIFHHIAIYLSFILVGISLQWMAFIFLMMLCFNRKVPGVNYWANGLLFFSTYILWYVSFKLDPGQFWKWFFD